MNNAPSTDASASPKSPRLLDQLRAWARAPYYSIRTEDACADWARRFMLLQGKRRPVDMGAAEGEAFLKHLAVDRNVSANTRNQTKAALLTQREVRELLLQRNGTMGLVASLLYGMGMRVPGRGVQSPLDGL